jgi:type IV pilus assembly protein PilC
VLPSLPLIVVFWKLIRKAGPGRAITDTGLLYIPVFGTLVRKTVIARFTRTLGTLVSAGVPILEAVKITKETSGNYVFEKALQERARQHPRGRGLRRSAARSKTCDAIVVNMIDVGEETGELDAMLLQGRRQLRRRGRRRRRLARQSARTPHGRGARRHRRHHRRGACSFPSSP